MDAKHRGRVRGKVSRLEGRLWWAKRSVPIILFGDEDGGHGANRAFAHLHSELRFGQMP
jgi:hypothetical protein